MKEKIMNYIQDWERKCYFNGIPTEVPVRIEQLNKAPSYKQLCKSILKNDCNLKLLGFNLIKPPSYHFLKRIELNSRKPNKQLKLF